jgi:hypothetical protein
MANLRRTRSALQEAMDNSVRRLDNAQAAQRKTKIEEKSNLALLHALAPDGILEGVEEYPIVDDGVPPSAPANVTAVPILSGLAIGWDQPDPEERVKAAEVRVTPTAGGLTVTVRATSSTGHTFLDLVGGTQYAIEARVIDAFGVTSSWSTPINATALTSAIDEIDLTELAILGRLQGLLPNANLGTIEDATKLGTGVVTAAAMAAGDAAFMTAWIDSAAIQSAMIAELVADKIVGGTISTTDIFVASVLEIASGGVLKAGTGTTIDNGGMTLAPGPDYNTPAFNTSQKISGTGDWASIAFYDDASPNRRGIAIRADGNGTRTGAVVLHATNNAVFGAASTAYVELIPRSTGGAVNIGHQLEVDDKVRADDFVIDNTGRSLLNDFATITDGGIQYWIKP